MSLFYDAELAAVTSDVVDLFAGPGGWSEALRLLGHSGDVGIELDRWACSTRRAAGHETLEANVALVDPQDFRGAAGLIASPPCQAFSTAGRKHGRTMLDQLIDAIDRGQWDARPHRDPNVWLVLEVGRWFDELLPAWVVLEQVPAVLPLWEHYAKRMHGAGWCTWTGVLDAADYGVPQNRSRAVLIASARDVVGRPPATHGTVDVPHVTMSAALGLDGFAAVSTGRDWNSATGESQTFDPATRPAAAITGKSGQQWHLLPGDSPRGGPGHRHLTVPEVLTLQSFPPDYPVRGNRTKQFEQIGNAVPPRLGAAVLAQVLR